MEKIISILIDKFLSVFIGKKKFKKKGMMAVFSIIIAVSVLYYLIPDRDKNLNAENSNDLGFTIIKNSSNVTIGNNITNDNKVTIIYNDHNQNDSAIELNGQATLIPNDNSFFRSTYLESDTFVNCENKPIEFNFTFIVDNYSDYTKVIIKWGDGTPNYVSNQINEKIDLKHLFPLGNSIMQAEFHDREGRIFIKSYNIFIGTNPSIGLGNPGNTNFCLNDSVYFIVSSFENNPPWTVYKFIIDDGSDTINFVNPEKNILRIPYQFRKASSNINYRKTKFSNWEHSFKATLIAENPCSYASASIMPIIVSDCNN